MSAYKRFIDGIIGPIGPTGPTGLGFDDISGVPHQLAYFGTSTELHGTPDACANIVTHQILFSSGSEPEPVISFQNDPDTGIWEHPSVLNTLVISAGGVQECAVSTNHISADAGSTANPSYNFGIAGDIATGIYRVAANTIGFSTGGSLETQISDISHISISGGSADIPALNFGLMGETDTGIFRVDSSAVGFSTGGVIEMQIADISNMSISGGSVGTPALNFGVNPVSGSGTGMFRIEADVLGFSTNGVQKIAIYSNDSGDFIEGLNVGTTVDTSFVGIRRLSLTASNSWEDGYLGNSSNIVFTCGDFNKSADSGSRSTTQFYYTAQSLSSARTFVGFTGTTDVHFSATKIIPKGFILDASSPTGILKLYSDNASGFSGTVVLIKRDDIGAGSASTGGFLLTEPILVWANGVSEFTIPTVAGGLVPSNGRFAITLLITTTNLQELTRGTGLLGASIPILRI